MQLTAKLRKPSTCDDLDVIALTIARCVSRYLEKSGYLVRDAESEYLELMQDQKDAKGAILRVRTDTSVRAYRLVSGPNAGLGAPGVGGGVLMCRKWMVGSVARPSELIFSCFI